MKITASNSFTFMSKANCAKFQVPEKRISFNTPPQPLFDASVHKKSVGEYANNSRRFFACRCHHSKSLRQSVGIGTRDDARVVRRIDGMSCWRRRICSLPRGTANATKFNEPIIEHKSVICQVLRVNNSSIRDRSKTIFSAGTAI